MEGWVRGGRGRRITIERGGGRGNGVVMQRYGVLRRGLGCWVGDTPKQLCGTVSRCIRKRGGMIDGFCVRAFFGL